LLIFPSRMPGKIFRKNSDSPLSFVLNFLPAWSNRAACVKSKFADLPKGGGVSCLS